MSNFQKLLNPFRDAARTECFFSVSDSNLGATETMHNTKYPLELFLRGITVSLETLKIANALPQLEIE